LSFRSNLQLKPPRFVVCVLLKRILPERQPLVSVLSFLFAPDAKRLAWSIIMESGEEHERQMEKLGLVV
jgi:hypothetical protein